MTALLSGLLPYLIAALGALGLFGAVFGYGRKSGVDAQKAKQAVAEKKASDISDQIDSDPLPADVAREELKKWGHQP